MHVFMTSVLFVWLIIEYQSRSFQVEIEKKKYLKCTSTLHIFIAQLWLIYTRWAIISGPPKFFVYNFHCKQQNFIKFQQEAYQDMLHHKQHKFHTVESQF